MQRPASTLHFLRSASCHTTVFWPCSTPMASRIHSVTTAAADPQTNARITFEAAAAMAKRLDAEVGRAIIGQPRVRREI
jgi:hypothetical protein